MRRSILALTFTFAASAASAQQACGTGDCETGVDGFAGHQEAAGGIDGTQINETSGVNNPTNGGAISGRIEAFGGALSIAGNNGESGVVKLGTSVLDAGKF